MTRPRRPAGNTLKSGYPKKIDVRASEAAALLDSIKILAVQAMFSDDDLLEQLVLKGGNAMALVHQISARASVDLDFSLKQDFGDDVAGAEARIHKALTETFRASGYEVFDFRMIEKPRAIFEDTRSAPCSGWPDRCNRTGAWHDPSSAAMLPILSRSACCCSILGRLDHPGFARESPENLLLV
jgi:hypothetical protein